MGNVKRNQLRHVDSLDVAFCDVKNVQRFLGVFKRYISGYIDKGNFELGDIIIDFNEVYARVCQESTDKYVRTIELFCEGYNLREIGERLGITAQAVHQVVKAFSKKVAKAYQSQLGLVS
ncbi:hypothetical protein FPV24_00520 [Carnobacterium sp. PL24RED07]|uniref:helix-turn-helix domain-containing protein n=1 Tax=unclassified Carnobacterium TaxID=257487 RepID=UPI0011EC2EBF|nr:MULTISPECIES: helix-turn-helix domain-containing protein [unclassified Carnobacterium]KAF3303624.1 hypothetical protein FPV22_00520 [Carnobacterium sp. PL26RED25]KAF3307142.1 hypothetical protein FPV24_00520 [Carnobacterium sp. PL24RED07]